MRFSLHEAIRSAARQRGMDNQVLFKRWAVECYLRRLSTSVHVDNFVLKGSYLFPVWAGDVVRSAVDLDLHCLDRNISAESIISKLVDISCEPSPTEDFAEFSPENMRFRILPPDSGQLIRASFPVFFGKTQLDVRIDVSIGERLTPGFDTAWYPSLMPGFTSFKLHCCTRDTMVAEKLALTIEFGADNTRIRDYFDLWFLITHFFFLSHNLQLALSRTLSSRQTCSSLLQSEKSWLGAYRESFATPLNERHWDACASPTNARVLAPSFQEALSLIRTFAEPVLVAVRDGEALEGTWSPGQGWRTSGHVRN